MRATRRAAAAGAIADLPAAGPSRAYATYRTMEGSLLDSEPSAPEEDNNPGPPLHRAPGNRREAKLAAKGKTVGKGKGVGKVKAVNRPGNQKTDGAQNKKNKGKHPVQAQSEKPLPLLSLPPLLESTVERREQATESAGPSSGSSAAVGRRTAGATSADTAHTSDGSDDDDDGQAVGIPPDELEWSEWYNWASKATRGRLMS
ncbi:hypothetical protein FOMPIDRAFT_1020316 [Fomitopsis schrenkii]|uniref:Uncharacterized protein n=1 Tax=Fomitopsis schrenkii TaxID=2126942 RepID=S8DMS0_FOMSC|nr:hypothetical protein FOMPIDRAFT_1020316 [Fomitopsis schrenkii]